MHINSLTSFSNFSPYANESRTLLIQQGYEPEAASVATGYHIYLDLKLTLNLRAAADSTNAKRHLRLLELYANLVGLSAAPFGGQVLEVQGERIHVLIPEDDVTRDSLMRLFAFSHVSAKLVYHHIKREAGESFQGFRQAADHGNVILLTTGSAGDDSIISLGPCANEPAKRLGVTGENAVPAGHLSVRNEWVSTFVETDRRRTWFDIDVLNLPQFLQPLLDMTLLTAQQVLISRGYDNMAARLQARDVRMFQAGNYPAAGVYSVNDPMKLQAVVLRADLDEFTAKVKEAFEFPLRDRAVVLLADEFLQIVAAADQVSEGSGRPAIRLPWAGDCANVLFLPKQAETYESFLHYASPDLGHRWHAQAGPTGTQWRPEWVVSVAGGDDDEGGNGMLLVATLPLGNRSFLIASGWGMGRSLDAHGVDGVRKDDTVIPACDYRALNSEEQKHFHKLTTVFYASGRLKTHDPKKAGVEALAAKPFSITLGTGVKPLSVPAPRPHCPQGWE